MKKRWIGAAIGGVLVLAVGVGVVMAQTPGANSNGNPTFLDRVAQKLGIDTSKLRDAIVGARSDQIDQAVQNGDLTQQQADNLKQRLDQLPDSALGGAFGRFPGGEGFRGDFKGGLFGASADKLASFLGISTDQLKTELQASNATLASVAQAHGKSRDDLKAFITDTVKQQLDQAVQNGKLTQQREDDIMSNLSQHLDQIIDNTMPHGRGGHFFGKPNGNGNGATPAPNATPSSGGTMPGALSRS